MPKSLTLFFIVEPPTYQNLACYLAASIRKHLPADVQLVGYCPAHRMDELDPAVIETLRRMRCDVRPMQTENKFDPAYPHGNKILACLEPRDTDFSGFVDSDVLMINDNQIDNLIKPGHVSASVAASMYWAPQKVWQTIYGGLDMDIPESRVTLMRDKRKPMIPYYSSGFVLFPQDYRTPDRQLSFPQIWMETAQKIDAIPDLEHKRPYLDQMSLPLAIQRAGLSWHQLPEEHHFILGGSLRGKPFPTDRTIYTVHYRQWPVLKENNLSENAYIGLNEQVHCRHISAIWKRDAPENITPVQAPTDLPALKNPQRGISINIATQLARIAPLVSDCSNGLMLGRQKLDFRSPNWTRRLIKSLGGMGITATEDNIFQPDQFCDSYLKTIGWPPLESLDVSENDDADHIHDLNTPIDDALKGRFDLVYDGGTTEHIFDIAQSFRNIDAMLTDNGIFVSCVATEGMFGHGFYQIGPDIPWRYWAASLGYRVLGCWSFSRKRRDTPREIEDPTDNTRGATHRYEEPQFLFYVVQKQPRTGPPNPVIHSRYDTY